MAIHDSIAIGDRFGRWTVTCNPFLKEQEKGGCRTYVLVTCDCGSIREVLAYNLLRSRSKSCGCLSTEFLSELSKSHGMTGTRAHRSWLQMQARINNKNAQNYKYYGGRGIVCSPEFETFEGFYAAMGPRPAGTTLERIDVNGPYSKTNCIWATIQVQNRNKRSNVILTLDGVSMCAADWCAFQGFKAGVITNRLKLGWSVKKALTTPVRPRRAAIVNGSAL